MSNEAILPATFVREYTRELHNKNAAVFAGAGLSMDSGYVDWKDLLREFIKDLGLDPDAETDLVTIAQFHCNQVGGKGALTQRIFDEFSKIKAPTDNHRILSHLPIQSYWTTNYDKLIETALIEAKKVPDIKYTVKHLAVTRLDRDVAIYKMHGDIDHPTEAVISKDDYESYPDKMGAYVAALRGDLIERTFLFLGLSFADPNLDFILSRVRVLYEGHQRHHYSIQKRVSKWTDESDDEFHFRELKQHYFIKDLKRFGIQTVLVDDYPEITNLLNEVATQFHRRSIFISGAAHKFGTWSQSSAENFLHSLSYNLSQSGCRIVTGFGLGVGGPVINGALAWLSDEGKTISDEDIVMRPFPQVATARSDLAAQWKNYREEMLNQAGIAIFVFGNKLDSAGDVIPSNGMRQEFEIAVKAGLTPIPIGATGFMARELWKETSADLTKFIPAANPEFRRDFAQLGDTDLTPDDLLPIISRLINHLQRS